MSDFEKNRADYVVRLEAQLKNLQQQLSELQADERWIPKVGTELDGASKQARITLSFGGKNQTAVVTYTTLDEHSVNDITMSILTAAFADLINDRLRTVIEPEVTKLKHSAKAIEKAGAW